MKRIAIYSRKSVMTDTGDSINNQIKMIKNYFSNEDCTFEIFEDEGFSGGNTNRPSFSLMMDKLSAGLFDIVAVYRIDRISRNIVDFVNIYEKLKKYDVNLVSITENFDPSTPYGKLVMIILATFAEMEREGISQRVKDNKIENAKMGKWCGGIAPFGYDIEKVIENGKTVSYLKENKDIDLVTSIFKSYLKYRSLHKVQKRLLFEHNIKWSLSTVKYILSSPIYCKSSSEVVDYFAAKNIPVYQDPNSCGFITYGTRPIKKGKREWNSDDMFVAVSKHFAPIESDLWLEVQYIQEEMTKAPMPKSSAVSYFTGVLKCGICGSPMTINYNHTNKDGTRNYYYICTGKRKYGASYCNNKNINNNLLDPHLMEVLINFTIPSAKTESNSEDEIISLKTLLKNNERKIDNLVDNLMEATPDIALVINKKLKLLSEENQTIKSKLIVLSKNTHSLTQSEYNDAIELLLISEHEDKRKILLDILNKIEWNGLLPFDEAIKIYPK